MVPVDFESYIYDNNIITTIGEENMSLKAEETKVVTIDGAARPVDDLPTEAQTLLRFYDDWKQRELEARSSLLMAQTAMRGLANEIAAVVKKAEESDGEDQPEDSPTE